MMVVIIIIIIAHGGPSYRISIRSNSKVAFVCNNLFVNHFEYCYYRTEEHYCVLAPFRNLVICASCVDILPKLFCNWFIWPIAEANSLRSTVLDSLVGTFVGVEEEQVCFVFVYSEEKDFAWLVEAKCSYKFVVC